MKFNNDIERHLNAFESTCLRTMLGIKWNEDKMSVKSHEGF